MKRYWMLAVLTPSLVGCVHVHSPSSSLPVVGVPLRETTSVESSAAVEASNTPKRLPAVMTVGFDATESLQDVMASEAARGLELETDNVESFIQFNESQNQSSVMEPTFTLEQLQALAIQNHPAIAAADAGAEVATGLRYQVGLKPNPVFGFASQQLAARGTDQHLLFVEQQFVRGNKLQLNRDVVGHTLAAQRQEVQTQRQRVMTDVRVRFFEAAAAQARRDAIREFETIAARGVEVAEQRFEAEEGTRIETLQSETLLAEVRLATRQAEAEYRGAWGELAAIAGLTDPAPVRLTSDLTTAPLADVTSPDWQTTAATIIAQSPEMAAARALVCEAQAMVRRQRAQPIPNVTTQFAAGFDNGTDTGLMNFQVAAPLPIHNKNTGNIAAANAGLTRAVRNVERIERSIQARVARATQDFDAARASVMMHEQSILPQATESLELSEQAYTAGELDFLQVLVVRRTYYEAQLRLIAARGELAQAAARIDGLVLTGGLDTPGDYTTDDGLRGQALDGN